MALLFMDGFDTADYAQKWPYVNATGNMQSSTTTRFSVGRSLQINDGGSFVRKDITPTASLYVGAAVYFTGVNSSAFYYFYADSAATYHHNLKITANNQLTLYSGTTQLAVYNHSTTFINNWFYIEMGGTVADVGGTAIIRINGVTVINFTGDTRNAGTSTNIDAFRLSGIGSFNSPAVLFDDLYVCDGTGTTNNTFLGDVRVQTLLPTAAGTTTQLTPTGSVNNYANVNDVPDSVSTYNSSATVGQRDTYVMGDLLAGTGTIFGVMETIHAFKTDAGAASIKSALRSGGNLYYGTTQVLGTTMVAYPLIRETDPATSAAWTLSNVNALEYGAEVA